MSKAYIASLFAIEKKNKLEYFIWKLYWEANVIKRIIAAHTSKRKLIKLILLWRAGWHISRRNEQPSNFFSKKKKISREKKMKKEWVFLTESLFAMALCCSAGTADAILSVSKGCSWSPFGFPIIRRLKRKKNFRQNGCSWIPTKS